VESLLIDPQTGKVSEVVIGVGGVLGIAEKRVVVPWSDLQLGRYDRSASAARDRTSSPSASPRTTPMK
jgi:PRC-barrel domain